MDARAGGFDAARSAPNRDTQSGAILPATGRLGTIAPGKLADFVLLDANPLVDIYNTRRIRAVVANGRFFDRGDLDALLVETERLARSSH